MNCDSGLVAAKRYAGQNFPAQPRLVPWVSLIDLGDDRLQFRADGFCYTLHTEFFINLFKIVHPLLNGNHTFNDICSSCEKEAPPEVIIFLLKALRDQGLLQEGRGLESLSARFAPVSHLEERLNFFSRLVSDSQAIIQALLKARIGVLGSEGMKTLISTALMEAGIPQDTCSPSISFAENGSGLDRKAFQKEVGGLDLLVACHETSGHAFFSRINDLCNGAGIRWLRVAVEGASASIGPTIVPGETACFACFERRRESHMPDFEGYREFKNRSYRSMTNPAEAKLPLFNSLVAHHAALEVARIVAGFAPPKTIGRFFQVTCDSIEATAHDVLRLPRCPICHPRRPRYETWDRGRGPGEDKDKASWS